ncbi:hypothetical protein FHS22_002180 [Planomonospora venezuelensis]|uniref:Uncharacterized protein n=1 Tax=Planomonospora venezuelensis TaxID=1999 RepID=A0A841CWX8_PLAVE|nr:hypothetical protein [Planomonospora venezuelensis]
MGSRESLAYLPALFRAAPPAECLVKRLAVRSAR